jgi:hypothetical protein
VGGAADVIVKMSGAGRQLGDFDKSERPSTKWNPVDGSPREGRDEGRGEEGFERKAGAWRVRGARRDEPRERGEAKP